MKHKTTWQQDDNILKLINISIDCREVLDFVEDNFEPAEVYSEKALSIWAKTNGWIKEE